MRLSFLSVIGLLSLVGFCAGVLAAPLLVLAQWDKVLGETGGLGILLFVIAATPIVGALNGALYGLLGFPLYRVITRRVNVQTYRGEFEVLNANGSVEI